MKRIQSNHYGDDSDEDVHMDSGSDDGSDGEDSEEGEESKEESLDSDVEMSSDSEQVKTKGKKALR
jgi:hypothetical protein